MLNNDTYRFISNVTQWKMKHLLDNKDIETLNSDDLHKYITLWKILTLNPKDPETENRKYIFTSFITNSLYQISERNDAKNIQITIKNLWTTMLPDICLGDPKVFDLVLIWLYNINHMETWNYLIKKIAETPAETAVENLTCSFSKKSLNLLLEKNLKLLSSDYKTIFLTEYLTNIKSIIENMNKVWLTSESIKQKIRQLLRLLTIELFKYGYYDKIDTQKFRPIMIKSVLPFIIKYADDKLQTEILKIPFEKFNHETFRMYIDIGNNFAKTLPFFSKFSTVSKVYLETTSHFTDIFSGYIKENASDKITVNDLKELSKWVEEFFPDISQQNINNINLFLTKSGHIKNKLSENEQLYVTIKLKNAFMEKIQESSKTLFNNLVQFNQELEQKHQTIEKQFRERFELINSKINQVNEETNKIKIPEELTKLIELELTKRITSLQKNIQEELKEVEIRAFEKVKSSVIEKNDKSMKATVEQNLKTNYEKNTYKKVLTEFYFGENQKYLEEEKKKIDILITIKEKVKKDYVDLGIQMEKMEWIKKKTFTQKYGELSLQLKNSETNVEKAKKKWDEEKKKFDDLKNKEIDFKNKEIYDKLKEPFSSYLFNEMKKSNQARLNITMQQEQQKLAQKNKHCFLNHAVKYAIIEDITKLLKDPEALNPAIEEKITKIRENLDNFPDCKENETEDHQIKTSYFDVLKDIINIYFINKEKTNSALLISLNKQLKEFDVSLEKEKNTITKNMKIDFRNKLKNYVSSLFDQDLKTVPESINQKYDTAIFMIENLVKALNKSSLEKGKSWRYLNPKYSSPEYKITKDIIILVYKKTNSLLIKNLILPLKLSNVI